MFTCIITDVLLTSRYNYLMDYLFVNCSSSILQLNNFDSQIIQNENIFKPNYLMKNYECGYFFYFEMSNMVV